MRATEALRKTYRETRVPWMVQMTFGILLCFLDINMLYQLARLKRLLTEARLLKSNLFQVAVEAGIVRGQQTISNIPFPSVIMLLRYEFQLYTWMGIGCRKWSLQQELRLFRIKVRRKSCMPRVLRVALRATFHEVWRQQNFRRLKCKSRHPKVQRRHIKLTRVQK